MDAFQDPAVLAPMTALDARAERLSVPTDDGHVVWRRWGRGPAVVLLHGGSGAWSHWVRNIDALAARHTVLAPDLPGYGESSDVPPGTPVAGLSARLAQTLPAALGDTAALPVSLVGFSFGGLVAGLWAADHPQHVRQLVLVGAVALGIVRQGQRPMRPWRYETDPAELDAIHRYNLATLMLHAPQAIDDLAVAMQDANVRRTRYVSKRNAHGDELAQALPRLRAPVAGIWGAHDITASGRIDEIAALLRLQDPRAAFEVLADAGHWVQYERADAFNARLLQLLMPPA